MNMRLFLQGMFILFDSSNQILDQLIKTKKSRPTSNINALTMNMPKRVTDDRYPTYGMDIPDSCKTFRNNFN
jgi:hypothetical protein